MRHFRQVAEHEILEMRIKKAFPGLSETEWSKCYSNVLECVTKSQYVSWENLIQFFFAFIVHLIQM